MSRAGAAFRNENEVVDDRSDSQRVRNSNDARKRLTGRDAFVGGADERREVVSQDDSPISEE